MVHVNELLELRFSDTTENTPTCNEIEALLNKSNVDLILKNGHSLLLHAVIHGNLEVANLLIKHGANTQCLSERLPNGETLLYRILSKEAISPTQEKIFNFLCTPQANVNPNIVTLEYYTPLYLLASDISKSHFITPLLEIGADPSWPLVQSTARNTNNRTFFEQVRAFDSKKKYEHELKNINEKEEAEKHFRTEETLREATHILGLDRTHFAGAKQGGHFIEGGYSFENYCLLQNILTEYAHTVDESFKDHFTQIQTALNLPIHYLQYDGTTTHQDLIDNHIAGKPTILPVRWPGHAIALIVWNDILILCNRGDKKLKDAISVFIIPPPGKLTKEILQTILPEMEKPSAKQVLEGINTWVNTTKPILTFPSQAQKHGTCSLVNIKSSSQPFLCFLLLLALKQKKEGKKPFFNSTFLNSLVKDGKSIDPDLTNAMVLAKAEYKKLTKHMRDQEVIMLCTLYAHCSDNGTRLMYSQIFKDLIKKYILDATPGIKKDFETNRAKMILKFIHPSDSGGIEHTLKYYNERYDSKWCSELLAWWTTKMEAQKNLNLAIRDGKLDIAQFLIEQGADINGFSNERDKGNYATPLWTAITTENFKTIKWLLEKGADLTLRDSHHTLLTNIVRARKWNVLKFLLEQNICFPENWLNDKASSIKTVLQLVAGQKDIMALIEKHKVKDQRPIKISQGETQAFDMQANQLTSVSLHYTDNVKTFETLQPVAPVFKVATIQNPIPSIIEKNNLLLEMIKKLQSINANNKQKRVSSVIKTSIIDNELAALEQSIQLKNANPAIISKRLKNFINQYNHKNIEVPEELCDALEALTRISPKLPSSC